MPTYEHVCLAEGCGHEFEDFYSIKADPPTICPSCKVEGKIKRLISGGCGVSVAMNDQELIADAKKGAAEMKRKLKTDEKYRANFIGDGKYHEGQLQRARISENLKNI